MVPLRREADRLFDDPLIDLPYQSVLLRYSQKRIGSYELAVSAHHANEQLLAGLSSSEWDDGLRIQDQSALIERLSDSPNPGQRSQFVGHAKSFRLLAGDVPKDDHGTLDRCPDEKRRGRNVDREH